MEFLESISVALGLMDSEEEKAAKKEKKEAKKRLKASKSVSKSDAFKDFTPDSDGISAITDLNSGLYEAEKGKVSSGTYTNLGGKTLEDCYKEAVKSGAAATVFNTTTNSCKAVSGMTAGSPESFGNQDTSVTLCAKAGVMPMDGCTEPDEIDGGNDWGPIWLPGWGVTGFNLPGAGGVPGVVSKGDCAKACAANPDCHAFSHTTKKGIENTCILQGHAVTTTGLDEAHLAKGDFTTYKGYAKTVTIPMDMTDIISSKDNLPVDAHTGWPGGGTQFEELGSVKSVEECAVLSRMEDNLGFAVRTSNHPTMPGSCIGIKKFEKQNPTPDTWDLKANHITGCANTGVEVANGCATAEQLEEMRRVERMNAAIDKFNGVIDGTNVAALRTAVADPDLPEAQKSQGQAKIAALTETARLASFGSYPGDAPHRMKGFSQAGDLGEVELGKQATIAECRRLAKDKGAPAFGVRLPGHSQPEYKGTCWAHSGGFSGQKVNADINHFTECANEKQVPSNGCRDPNRFILVMSSSTPALQTRGHGQWANSNGARLEFQGDGNLVIYKGNKGGIPWVWASHHRFNKIYMQGDGNFIGDNGAGQYKASMVDGPHSGVHNGDAFGPMSQSKAVQGVANGPYSLYFATEPEAPYLIMINGRGEEAWRSTDLRSTFINRRNQSEASLDNLITQGVAYDAIRAHWAARSTYIPEALWKNTYLPKWGAGAVAADVRKQENFLSMIRGKILVSSAWDGEQSLLSKSSPRSVTAGSYKLAWQGDGNLVVYKGNKALWDSGTRGSYLAVSSSTNRVLVYNDNKDWSSDSFHESFNTNHSPNSILHFGIDITGRLLMVRNNRVVWLSPSVVDKYLAFPIMGDRPGGEMRITFSATNNHKIASTKQWSANACAKKCNNFKGIGGWFRDYAPKKCDAFAYNEDTRQCYLMNKEIENTVGEVANGFTYYRKN